MVNTPEFRLNYAILCEMAKLDVDGKWMLIGIYTGDIAVPSLPSLHTVSIFINLDVQETGEFPLFIRFSGPGDDSGVVAGRIFVSEPQHPTIVVPDQHLIKFACEGEFKVDVSFDEENWIAAIRAQVRLRAGEDEASEAVVH